MRSFAISLFFLSLVTAVAPQRQAPAGTCFCPVPPGGTCKCDTFETAICTIVNNQCATTCKKYAATLPERELVVTFLQDITRLPPAAIGFNAKGDTTNPPRAQASLEILDKMLATGRPGSTQYQAFIPPEYLAGIALEDRGTVRVLGPNINVSIPSETAERLRRARIQMVV
jgi:hypothetical protein